MNPSLLTPVAAAPEPSDEFKELCYKLLEQSQEQAELALPEMSTLNINANAINFALRSIMYASHRKYCKEDNDLRPLVEAFGLALGGVLADLLDPEIIESAIGRIAQVASVVSQEEGRLLHDLETATRN